MKLGWTVHYPSERPAPWMRRFAFGENSAPGGVEARAAERTKYDVAKDRLSSAPHREEIHRGHLLAVVCQEGPPGL